MIRLICTIHRCYDEAVEIVARACILRCTEVSTDSATETGRLSGNMPFWQDLALKGAV